MQQDDFIFKEIKDINMQRFPFKKRGFIWGEFSVHKHYGYRSIGFGTIQSSMMGYKSIGFQFWFFTVAWDWKY